VRRLAGQAWILVVSTLLAFALLAPPAAAESRHRVVVLEPPGTLRYPELRARLRGELLAAGFDVVSVAVTPGEPMKASAERAAAEHHPAAVVWVVEPEPAAPADPTAPAASPDDTGEIWILDRLLPHTYVLTFDATVAGAGDATRVPVTAVEILKADLAELSLTHVPPPPPRLAPPPVSPPLLHLEHRAWRFVVEPGFALLAGFSGLDSTWTPVLRAGVRFPATWETVAPPVFELRARVATFGGEVVVTAPEGEARVKQTLVGVEGVARLLSKSVVQPFFLVSAGAYSAHVAGKSTTAAAHSETTWSFATGGGLGLWFQPSAPQPDDHAGWAFVTTGALEVAVVPTAVRIAERRVATAGAPTGLLSAGIAGFF
jgi:hypothetical protein